MEASVGHCFDLVGTPAATFKNSRADWQVFASYSDDVMLTAHCRRFALRPPAFVPKRGSSLLVQVHQSLSTSRIDDSPHEGVGQEATGCGALRECRTSIPRAIRLPPPCTRSTSASLDDTARIPTTANAIMTPAISTLRNTQNQPWRSWHSFEASRAPTGQASPAACQTISEFFRNGPSQGKALFLFPFRQRLLPRQVLAQRAIEMALRLMSHQVVQRWRPEYILILDTEEIEYLRHRRLRLLAQVLVLHGEISGVRERPHEPCNPPVIGMPSSRRIVGADVRVGFLLGAME